MIYAFDLDSTLTKEETLPFLAKELGILEEYEKTARETQELEYEEALRQRLALFSSYSDAEISRILETIPVFPHLREFILQRAEHSCIITSNLAEYVKDLAKKFNCKVYASAKTREGISVIKKEEIVKDLQRKDKVYFTGDGENDADALKAADFSIAASYAKKANEKAAKAANAECFSEDEAVRRLTTLL